MPSGAGHTAGRQAGQPGRSPCVTQRPSPRRLCELRLQPDGLAHVSYWTSAGERRRGCATRALALLLDYGNSIGVTRFEAHIARGNVASRRVPEKAGFRFTGTFTGEDGALMVNTGSEIRRLCRWHCRHVSAPHVGHVGILSSDRAVSRRVHRGAGTITREHVAILAVTPLWPAAQGRGTSDDEGIRRSACGDGGRLHGCRA